MHADEGLFILKTVLVLLAALLITMHADEGLFILKTVLVLLAALLLMSVPPKR